MQEAIGGAGVGDGNDQPVGDELAVEGFDDVDLFEVLFLAPFIQMIREVSGGAGIAIELIDGAGCQLAGTDMRMTVVGNELAADVCLEDFEVLQVLYDDEIGGIAGAEHTAIEMIMFDGVDAGGFQYLEDVDASGNGAGAEAVDMAGDEAVRMQIIAAEHHVVGMVVEESDQGVEIFCGAAFADQNFHAVTQLIEGFIRRKAFMIGADAGFDVIFRLLAAETGGVTVDGLFETFCACDLGHYFGVFVEDAGEVHHFAEVPDLVAGEEGFDFFGVEGGAGCLECGGRDAAGGAEIEVKGHGIAVADHEFDAGEAADVGDLAGVADRGDCAVSDGDAGEFGGDEEGAFDVDVGVDEAGEDVGAGGGGCGARGRGAGGGGCGAG